MIRARIMSYEENADPFVDGLRAWMNGDDSADAEAAGIMLGETILLHRDFLRSLGKP